MRNDRWVARVEVNHMYRCKVCELYFWDKEKMKRHKHEEEKQVPT